MPLRCLLDDKGINAFNQSQESWDALKVDYRVRDLRMVCCGNPAVPKTSSLGTFFFAHKNRGTCTSAPETKEHLLAKSIIAKAAEASGWQVTTEYRGKSPDGKPWIADVLVTRGGVKLAFEVQWSTQTDVETAARQELYKLSGVRCLWLFKQQGFISSLGVPAFHLALKADQTGFSVDIPTDYDPMAKRGGAPYEWGQSVDLEDFIKGCLRKKLEWLPTSGRTVPIHFNGPAQSCWKCKRETLVILEIVTELTGARELIHTLADFDDHPEILTSIIPRELYDKGVGRIKLRKSATAGTSYLSNGCTHCDALQGRFFKHEHQNYHLIMTSLIGVTPTLMQPGAICPRIPHANGEKIAANGKANIHFTQYHIGAIAHFSHEFRGLD